MSFMTSHSVCVDRTVPFSITNNSSIDYIHCEFNIHKALPFSSQLSLLVSSPNSLQSLLNYALARNRKTQFVAISMAVTIKPYPSLIREC